MTSRSSVPLALAVAVAATLSACGGERAAAPSSPTADAAGPRSAAGDRSIAVETARRTPVPPPGDGARLVLLRAGSVWIVDGDGPPSQLTVRPLASPDERPTLSPDGRLVAFASQVGDVHRIHVVSLDDLIPLAVTDGGGIGDSEPAFAPDGATLYFMRGDPRDGKDLHRIDLAAALDAAARRAAPPAAELLLAGDDDEPEQAGAPVATPDGTAIILAADRRAGQGTGLYRFELARRRLVRLTPVAGPRAIDREPAVSPDGARIAFASNRHDARRSPADDFDVYAIAPDGSGLTRLTDDPGSAYDPAYSADGNRLYFVSTRDRQGAFEEEVYLMAAGGGVQRRLTRDAQPQNRAPFAGRAR
jgi:Tol biopolymer transport system component